MSEAPDHANTLVRPPIALLLAVVAGLALDWLYPLQFVPAGLPYAWVGAAVFVLGLTLVVWAIVTFQAAGTPVQGYKPTSAIVDRGPYRFTRNPIYGGMFVGLTGLAVAFNTLWLLAALVVFFAIIRFGVVAREEAYLERKFGDAYGDYRARVRRWL
jgi:protein-S-isoprenylcysteine O-methyltransferase Ste14